MPNRRPSNGSGSIPGVPCCPSISPGRTRGLDPRNRVGHIPIEARFDLHFDLKVRDHDISCQGRTARPISWATASLPWSEYHPNLEGILQGATCGVARMDKILKRRYTVMETPADLVRPPVSGAISGSRRSWRRMFEGRVRARDGV